MLQHSSRKSSACGVASPANIVRCSDKALSNHKAVTDSFRNIYGINSGKGAGQAVAVGRYAEDVYYNGNPWYLANLAAAEQLYDALYTWKKQSSITVTSVSLSFFRDLVSSVQTGTYASGSSTFNSIINAVQAYADGYVAIVEQYAGADGSLAEQFDRNNGSPLSAADLTWSYAAFLTAADRRRSSVPYSWITSGSTNVPNQCQGSSAQGTYSAAPTGTFPPNQTPSGGVPTTTARPTTTSGTRTSTSAAPCQTANPVAVTFNVLATTQFGQTIKVVGNNAAIGNWNTGSAVALSASQYTSSNPLWSRTVSFPAGTVLQYKYINVASSGGVTWEKDPNRSFTVPRSCQTAVSVNGSWQA